MFVLCALGKYLADVVMSLDIRSVLLNHTLEIGESLNMLSLPIPRQASLEVALLVEVLIVRLIPLLW